MNEAPPPAHTPTRGERRAEAREKARVLRESQRKKERRTLWIVQGSIAVVVVAIIAVVALVLSPAGAWAYRRHSPFPFYLLAAFLLAVLSMGPHPSVMGTSIMTHSPYLGLMQLPGFDALRVLARFWMLALVCVSAAVALAYARLVLSGSRRTRAALAVVTMALLADG